MPVRVGSSEGLGRILWRAPRSLALMAMRNDSSTGRQAKDNSVFIAVEYAHSFGIERR